MIYFDTDVLINMFVEQNTDKHLQSIEIINASQRDNSFLISWISIQEMGFVLAKLGNTDIEISLKITDLIDTIPVAYTSGDFQRAIELAKIIGFKDFNDCLHTAIAEQNCTDLYTYNRADFARIQPLTTLNIHIL